MPIESMRMLRQPTDFRGFGGQGSTTNHIKPEINVIVQGNADRMQ